MKETEEENEKERGEKNVFNGERERLARGANKRRFASAHNEGRERRLFEWEKREKGSLIRM